MTAAPSPAMPPIPRNVAIAGGVVLLHVAALWAFQAGLLRRAVEIVVPVQVVSELVTPPLPPVEPPPPAPRPPEPVAQPQLKQKLNPAPPPAPKPAAVPSPAPALAAPTGVVEPQPAPSPVAAAVAESSAPATPPPAPARLELPSTSADYLQNPRPPYPPTSKRLGEQGTVRVRVLIGADGLAQDAQLAQSSGYPRLDTAAVDTVRKWRYVPGKRGGIPETMWFTVPITFVLE
jgi:protein TonB